MSGILPKGERGERNKKVEMRRSGSQVLSLKPGGGVERRGFGVKQVDTLGQRGGKYLLVML